MDNLKCIHCIEAYIKLDEEDKNVEVWNATVNDAVTLVPAWQMNSFMPGQMVIALATLPVCLKHIQVQPESPDQQAAKSGLILPTLVPPR